MATELRERKRLRAELESVMVRRGLRSTSQRRLILDRLFEIGEHFTADDLIADVRLADASVGSATVYRTLRMLVESGLLEEHHFADHEGTRFELHVNDKHHDHIICMTCGKIREFEEPLIEQLQERVAEQLGFKLESHTHQLYGYCADCSAASAKSRGSKG
ncbi:MAG: Fur family transcriptional regulator [Deltaproteobacteria bacterium]